MSVHHDERQAVLWSVTARGAEQGGGSRDTDHSAPHYKHTINDTQTLYKKKSSKEGFRNKRSDQGSVICNQICPAAAAAVFPGIFPRTRQGKKSGMNSDCIRLPGEENIAGAATEHLQPATTDSQHLAVFSQ